jgi:hypothetical protein
MAKTSVHIHQSLMTPLLQPSGINTYKEKILHLHRDIPENRKGSAEAVQREKKIVDM